MELFEERAHHSSSSDARPLAHFKGLEFCMRRRWVVVLGTGAAQEARSSVWDPKGLISSNFISFHLISSNFYERLD